MARHGRAWICSSPERPSTDAARRVRWSGLRQDSTEPHRLHRQGDTQQPAQDPESVRVPFAAPRARAGRGGRCSLPRALSMAWWETARSTGSRSATMSFRSERAPALDGRAASPRRDVGLFPGSSPPCPHASRVFESAPRCRIRDPGIQTERRRSDRRRTSRVPSSAFRPLSSSSTESACLSTGHVRPSKESVAVPVVEGLQRDGHRHGAAC